MSNPDWLIACDFGWRTLDPAAAAFKDQYGLLGLPVGGSIEKVGLVDGPKLRLAARTLRQIMPGWDFEQRITHERDRPDHRPATFIRRTA